VRWNVHVKIHWMHDVYIIIIIIDWLLKRELKYTATAAIISRATKKKSSIDIKIYFWCYYVFDFPSSTSTIFKNIFPGITTLLQYSLCTALFGCGCALVYDFFFVSIYFVCVIRCAVFRVNIYLLPTLVWHPTTQYYIIVMM